MKRKTNLGGIAEVVAFVPCIGASGFLFVLCNRGRKIMKLRNVMIVLAVFVFVLVFAGSSKKEEVNVEETGKKKVVVLKQLDHASIDEIAEGIQKGIESIDGEHFEVVVMSGQNDAATMKQVVEDSLQNDTDVIVPIGTLAAQISVSSTSGTDVPVVYSAISDPEAAELTGIANVTGTSDAIDVSKIVDLMDVYHPELKKVGFLYSLSETNSARAIQSARDLLSSKGVEIIDATANTNDEIASAVALLIQDGVDCVFTPTDNVIMNHAVFVADQFNQAKVPFFTGADSFVLKGAFATCGINYQDLAYRTSELVIDVLNNGIEGKEDVYYVESNTIVVSEDTAKVLGVDPMIFEEVGTVNLMKGE